MNIKLISVGLLVLILLPLSVSAQNIVSIGNFVVDTDTTINVPIYLNDSVNVGSVGLNLSYDPDIVQIFSDTVKDKGNFTDFYGSDNRKNASGWITINAYKIGTGLNGNLIVGYVRLHAIGGAGKKTQLRLKLHALTDPKGNEINPGNELNGNFSIKGNLTADCGSDKLKCENVASPVQFNASSSYPADTIVSYQWEFGDGINVTGVTPKHTYTAYRWIGTGYQPFVVNLTVTDNEGLTDRTSQQVSIWIAGDATGDGKVNILDASNVGLKWGSSDPCADLNNDNKVNILDASIIGLNWGRIA